MNLDIPSALQGLSPASARLCLEAEAFIFSEQGIDPAGLKLVVALSGGADSTALLLALNYLAPKCGFSLTACHLDHALRPSSLMDALFAAELCGALGVHLDMGRTEVAAMAEERKMGIEEAGRAARLEHYALVRNERGADYVATAHHLNDLAEDVLMRLGRGSGWPALSGMRAVSPEEAVIRPFLLTPKADILAFLTDLNAPWREDPTNKDQAFARNRMRANVLPAMLRENPGFLAATARLWRMGAVDREYWEKDVADRLPSPDKGRLILPRDLLESSARALRLRLYKAALDALGPGQALADNLFKLDAAFAGGRHGAVLQFPGPKTALVSDKGIEFSAGS